MRAMEVMTQHVQCDRLRLGILFQAVSCRGPPGGRTDGRSDPAATKLLRRGCSAEPTVLQPARSARVTPPADQRVRASRRDSGLPPSAMGPWAPGSGAVRATDGGGTGHGRARKRPRTGPVGAVMQTALTWIPPLTCHFRMPAPCRRRPRQVSSPLAVWLGIPGSAVVVAWRVKAGNGYYVSSTANGSGLFRCRHSWDKRQVRHDSQPANTFRTCHRTAVLPACGRS